ncbi:DUF6057 family protein [Draconibacterium sp. IB214405]|uniref:DUF6057 family protein n=1 Tax=Draconibacterium sp. IB214405 TaxID=3097352 RepID=UPI002A1233CB|nr:DUF6057 family protein [Draconibacterium sp. IB214405]MDX8338048.1 DUF6057 family protein [Draconibacterium sp. IB214405]
MKEIKDKYIIRFWNGLFFIALLVFWRFFYADHLLQKEQMQLFLLTFGYLKDHLSLQGGLAIYLGEFITQFFLNKWVAAILVSILLISLAIGIQKVLKAILGNGIYILSFLPILGYHFMLFNPYYKLSGLVAVTLSVWSLFLFVQSKKAKMRTTLGFILLLLNYWFLGGTFILFVLAVILVEILLKSKANKSFKANQSLFIFIPAFVIVGLVIPYLTRQFLITDHLLSAYFSRAFYQFSFLISAPVICMLVSLPILLLIYGWLPKIGFNSFYGVWGVLLLAVLVLGSNQLAEFSEEKEMSFDNLVPKQEWNGIIQLAEKVPPEGKQAKLALSLALAKTGQLSTKLFHFNPEPNDFFIPFNIRGQAPIIANEPYFYLGLTNFSKMLCIETIESTPDETMPVRAVKRLAENYIIDGQYKLAERYLWYLERTLFYRKWAINAKQYLYNDDKITTHPVWRELRKQRVHDDFYYQYENNDLALVSLLRSDQQNKMAYEYLMGWYLLRKDFDEFLKYLPLVNTFDYKKFPVVFQEALAYIFTLYDEVPENLKQFPISAEVQQQLNRYAQAFQQGGSNKPDEMKKLFGNTYWYYVHFTEFENE